jgi:hypothetical protein
MMGSVLPYSLLVSLNKTFKMKNEKVEHLVPIVANILSG